MSQDTAKIAVLGAGSWGTALASLMARHRKQTVLWGRNSAIIDSINQRHENPRYLPNVCLPELLTATTDFNQAVHQASWVLIAMPSHAFTQTVVQLRHAGSVRGGVAWATKGFEPGSGRFLHEVARSQLGLATPLAVVTGPSFALEVTQGLPTAVTVHSEESRFAQKVADALHGPTFRVYTGQDVIGAELGGAMKNVLAVAAGVADGMHLGLNARAGLITRGLNEMLRLAAAIGGRPETLMGLAGLGDLVLSCTGDLSRNRQLGLALGQGRSLAEAVQEIGQVVESVQTVDEVIRQAEQHHIDLPITSAVQAVLRGQMTAKDGLRELLARQQKPEYSKAPFVGQGPTHHE